ncbi:hypothetical protein IWW35_005240 [Coemansia sp. RSA 1878]|nr:hypothetical protein IWW35_005240 [Coemansia sp. RSA 1878]
MTVKDTQRPAHKKLRVLCLHGYEQDSAIFRTKLRQHTDSLADIAEFVFVDAPNEMQPYDTSGVDNMARAAAVKSGETLNRVIRGWYGLKSAEPERVCGLETSIAYLTTVLNEQGPFDGIFGFSQGKCGLMAGVMCALLENRYEALGKKCAHPPFAFAIIASGYMLSDSKWKHLYERPLSTPSLHMYGILDSYIHVSKSIDLCRVYSQSAELSTHGG